MIAENCRKVTSELLKKYGGGVYIYKTQVCILKSVFVLVNLIIKKYNVEDVKC